MINKNDIVYIINYDTLEKNVFYQKDEKLKEKLLEKLYSIDYLVMVNGSYLDKIKIWLILFNNGILPNKIYNLRNEFCNNKKFLKKLKIIKNGHKQTKKFVYVDDNENVRTYSLKEMTACNFVAFKKLIKLEN